MSEPSMTILYVDNPAASADFYEKLLGRACIEASPTFRLFDLGAGKLALWSRHAVEPRSSVTGGGGELVFIVENSTAVNAIHADWSARGLVMAQAPVDMDFGRTFVALDPDGHRLRVCAPDQP